MSDTLAALETLYDAAAGALVPLPAELAALYGPLRLAAPADRPHVTSNFVSTMDGVVSLGEPGTGSDEITGGGIPEDRFVMGLLRAVADVIIVGAGTLRAFPQQVWTPEAIYKPFTEAFARLRRAMGKTAPPLTVLVTATGDLDLSLPVFSSATAPAIVVTTAAGARALARPAGSPVRVVAAGPGPALAAAEILKAVNAAPASQVLLECGPRLMGRFLADRAVDELFLTVAPQVAGRAPASARQGLAANAVFVPDDPRWATLSSIKRCASVLFLRYRFESAAGTIR
jgi:riboflavin biosynthesis pyrimidine reductase